MGVFRKIVDAVAPTQSGAYQKALAKIAEAKAQNATELDLSVPHKGKDADKLTVLPPEIEQLTNLTDLNLQGNSLKEVPAFIGNLSQLTILSLRSNNITEVSVSIGNLSQLTELYLSENQLTEIPAFIGSLSQLTTLGLSFNKLKEVPAFIDNLSQLTYLSLRYNKLIKVPAFIGHLPKLKVLNLANNPIETPSLEILDLQGKFGEANLRNLQNYYRQVEEEGVDHLYEAKLLILGEAGAGKTTFAKKLADPSYPLDNTETSTEGIDVIHIEFPLPDGNRFRVNIWDFGGQEIYHATHQFFLTARSLYTLVSDTRKEDTDFHYWLNAVELLSDNSPLLIIQNEKQGRKQEINEPQLRGQFGNLEKVLATDLATNRGLPQIYKAIQHYITDLPHIGTPLPKTWVKVRHALDNDPRPYITATEFYALCDEAGFKQQGDKKQLSGFLHDLGVHLHFQDDPILKHWVILQPEWGTTAVYNALDNDTVHKNLGRFNRTQLGDIWQEDAYANMHDELLRLMINFKLCYPVPHTTESYIAPQLLSPKKPDYAWQTEGNLHLRYHYGFMPKGILTRFIVALHPHIADQKLVWKTGVVLAKENTRAEVIEYYGQREIQIRITGDHPRDLLTIVVHELDSIHGSFNNRLKVTKLVPCHCQTCADNPTPHFYAFEKLRERLARGKKDIECQEPPYEDVAVRPLLDNVFGRHWVENSRRDIFNDARTLDEAGMLFGDVRATLLRCDGFDSNQQLQAIFADPRLKIWQVTLPDANSAGERVDFVLDYLYNKENVGGDNGLVLFLRVLSERMPAGDASRERLEGLVRRLG